MSPPPVNVNVDIVSSRPHRLSRWSFLSLSLSSSPLLVDTNVSSFRRYPLMHLSLSLSSSPPTINIACQRQRPILSLPPPRAIFVVVVVPVPVPAAFRRCALMSHPPAATAMCDLCHRHCPRPCPCPCHLLTSRVNVELSRLHRLAQLSLLLSSPPSVSVLLKIAGCASSALMQEIQPRALDEGDHRSPGSPPFSTVVNTRDCLKFVN